MMLSRKKQAGVCLHLTSLPGKYGIGEIGDAAKAFIDLMSSAGLAVWQFLPTGPTAFGDSPYQPLSTYAGNELLIDIESLVRDGLLTPDETKSLRDLPQDTVDYGRLIPLKNALLALGAGRFSSTAGSGVTAEFDQFLDENDERWLHEYALFRVLKTRHGEKPWPEWERPLARRDGRAIRRIENEAAQQLTRVKVLQFLFHRQWMALRAYASDKRIRLFGDMPIYVAHDSADAWAHPEMLRIDRCGRPDRVAGVPPDYFSEDGQRWGNPLYDWDHHAANRFEWWIDRLRHAFSLADLVRIDHFRGFEAYWSVPADSDTARRGKWVRGPGRTLFEAIRLALGDPPIIAEDLGVITPAVESLRRRYRIPGMKVLQYEIDDAFDIENIEEDRVCYTGTHDNDTTVGWFRGSPGERRTKKEIAETQARVLALTKGRPETVHEDFIKLAFRSKARLAIAPMQDYLGLGSEARLNTPGTSSCNWRWRLLQAHLRPELRDAVHEMVVAGGRETGG